MSERRKVLVVEDEADIAEVLIDYLSRSYDTQWLANGSEVLPAVQAGAPDLILLDLNLPGRDGTDVCRDVRAFSSVPIVMLTARVEEIDRLLGLELGADDYICKPFYPREVVARVRRLIERASPAQDLTGLGLHIDTDTYRATLAGQPLDLTPVEFRLLAALAERPGRVLSRDQLMDRIYDDRRVVSDRTIDGHVRNLRSKLEQRVSGESPIHSVYGVGYRFDLP